MCGLLKQHPPLAAALGLREPSPSQVALALKAAPARSVQQHLAHLQYMVGSAWRQGMADEWCTMPGKALACNAYEACFEGNLVLSGSR